MPKHADTKPAKEYLRALPRGRIHIMRMRAIKQTYYSSLGTHVDQQALLRLGLRLGLDLMAGDKLPHNLPIVRVWSGASKMSLLHHPRIKKHKLKYNLN